MSATNTPTTPGTPVSDQPPNYLSKIASKPIIFSQSTSRRKPQPIEKKLDCTLEELCNGCIKKVIITRDVVATTGYILYSTFFSFEMKLKFQFCSFGVS